MRVKKVLFILFTIVLFTTIVLSTFNTNINKIALYGLLPITFLLIIVKKPSTFKFKPLIMLYMLFIWMGLTGFVATNIEFFFNDMKKMMGVVLFSTITVGLIQLDKKNLNLFYILFFLKFITIFIYGYNRGLTAVDTDISRFGLEDLNANMFGYYAFFSVSSLHLIRILINKEKYGKLINLLLIAGYSMGLISSYYAASRASIIILILCLIIFSSIEYLFPIKIKSVFLIASLGIVLFFTQNIVLDQAAKSNNSLLIKRFTEIEEDSRIDLFKKGIEIGLSSPLIGVGTGQFMNYSEQGTHSSYSEIFATNGIFGLLMYLILLFEPIKKSITMYKNRILARKSLFFIAFFSLFILYNFFYWFHISIFMLGFFFIVRMHLEWVIRSQKMSVSSNTLKNKSLAN